MSANKNQCPAESGTHYYVSDGTRVFCNHCGEPLQHHHLLERDVEASTANKDVFNCTHPHCEYGEEEMTDATP